MLVGSSGWRRMTTASGSALAAPPSDWASLWRELVGRAAASDPERSAGDHWAGRAESFDARVHAAPGRPDMLREFVLARVVPDDTVLDIGAGTGTWAFPLARRAASVTALDSSDSMLEVLRRKVAVEEVRNIDAMAGSWPEVRVDQHDHVLAIHSVYGTPDLPRFVDAMTATARRACYLVVTCPLRDSVTTRAALELWGTPWGRPDFVVAYNVMLEMGLMPSVMMDRGSAGPIRTVGVAEALSKVKRLLGLGGTDSHDCYLLELLSRTLEPDGDGYRWPPQARAALVYWSGGR